MMLSIAIAFWPQLARCQPENCPHWYWMGRERKSKTRLIINAQAGQQRQVVMAAREAAWQPRTR